MGKSWDHKISALPEAEKSLTDQCQFGGRPPCPNFPQFRVEYKFAPAVHGKGASLALKDGPTEQRKFLYCLAHADFLARKEGICLTCGTRFAKTCDCSICGSCFKKRQAEEAGRAAAAAIKAQVSAPPIVPPTTGTLETKPRKPRKAARR